MKAVRIVSARRVHTMAGAPGTAGTDRPVTALAVLGEQVVATGTTAALRSRFPGAEHFDHGPGVIVPGFNDAHQHLGDLADGSDEIDLSTAEFGELSAVLAALAARIGAAAPGKWVRAHRYDETRTAPRALTRGDLDSLGDSAPVLVTHVSDHSAVLNTRALHIAGLDPERVPDGRVHGPELFRLLWSDEAIVDKPSTDGWIAGVERLTARYHAAGITSIGDALVSPGQLGRYQEARRRGRLTVRVNALVDVAHADAYLSLGVGSGFGDSWLRIGGFKAFVDGAVAGRSCLLEQPFSDSDPPDHGEQVTPTAELHALFERVHRAGSTMAVHANGDRAIGVLLDVVEQVQAAHPRPGPVHRIEHCTVLGPGLAARIKAAGLAAVPFGSYLTAHGTKLLQWYGAERLHRMFPHRTLLDHAVPVAGASDHSAAPFEPLIALRDMVTRTSPDGVVLGASQRITAADALWTYTVGSATVAGEAHVKGALTPGRLADYVVLDDDPLTVDPDGLAEVGVRETVVGGVTRWTGGAR
ncbi:amidohydrolase [Streptomyces sp. NPDC017979]|uniref:amidohydrolase n=1 Tax=Streptomyces sp. NPDC017979 TaxID=3365024 RepID=UPI00379B80A4